MAFRTVRVEDPDLLEQLHADAQRILGEHQPELKRVVTTPIERESLDEESFRALLAGPAQSPGRG